jgi:hypothetical protein
MHRVKLQIILNGIANKTLEQTIVEKSAELKNDAHKTKLCSWVGQKEITQQKKQAVSQ